MKKWYPATIQELPTNTTPGFTVLYTDATTEKGVDKSRIRTLGEGEAVGGVFFLDEAYDLDPANSQEGRAIMAELMAIAEDHRDTVTIIIAGYKEDIESKLYAYNIGMASRFQSIHFEDFTTQELEKIWNSYCETGKWESSQSVAYITSRRLARMKGIKGFGNARAMRNMYETAVGVAKERFYIGSNERPTIVVQDIIGFEPNRKNNHELDSILRDLEQMTGQHDVKKMFYNLVGMAEANYHKELRGEPIDDLQLNRVFLGNPGLVES